MTTERPGANGPVFDADGMTPDEFAEGFLRHSAARAAERMKKEDARDADLTMRLIMLWATMPAAKRPLALAYLRGLINETA